MLTRVLPVIMEFSVYCIHFFFKFCNVEFMCSKFYLCDNSLCSQTDWAIVYADRPIGQQVVPLDRLGNMLCRQTYWTIGCVDRPILQIGILSLSMTSLCDTIRTVCILFYSCYMFRLCWKAVMRQIQKHAKKDS